MYPALEKNIPIRVTNTLDYTHPGTLIEPAAAHLRPRVCEVTHLTLAQYEHANKTRLPLDAVLEESRKNGGIALVAVVGHRLSQIHGLQDRIWQILQRQDGLLKYHVSIPDLADSAFVVAVPAANGKSTAKLLHDAFIARQDQRRWLVPSKFPTAVTIAPALGAGWA